METKEDLQKLTVVQLREKLKGRNLPTTGTKNELIDRLYENFQEEENLLSGSGANDDLDVDALLGTNLDEHSLTSKEEALLLGINPKTTKIAETLKASPQKPVVQPKSTEPTPKVPQEAAKKVEAPTGDATKPADAPKPARQPIRSVVSAETGNAEDKKKQRAERFGLPIQKSTEEKPTEQKQASPDKEKHPISLSSNSKLLERAKRFGLPVQGSETENDGASKPKIPRISSGTEDEAKLRRMQRFGAK